MLHVEIPTTQTRGIAHNHFYQQYDTMPVLYGYILETDKDFAEFCEWEMTVRKLLEKIIKHKKWDCSTDELNLYFARKNGQFLRENHGPEVFALYLGKLSDGLREIMNEDNKIHPDMQIEAFLIPGIFFLLEAPPRIRRKYRRSVATTRRSYIELGQLAVEDADLESLEELSWWERLSSYLLPSKVGLEKKEF